MNRRMTWSWARSLMKPSWNRPSSVKITTKDGMAWREAHQDKPIITREQNDDILGMINAAWSIPIVSRILGRPGHSEVSMFSNHPETGLLLKGRVDRQTTDEQGALTFVDVKTTDDASLAAFARTVAKFRYHVQDAMYSTIAESLGLAKPFFLFVAIERKPPYAVGVYQLDDGSKEHGKLALERELALFKTCSESNQWPGYPEAIQILSLPNWKLQEVAA
jgi:exodeoxyribonuclease VIII